MKKTKTDSKERKVKDSIQSICVNEQFTISKNFTGGWFQS